MKKFQKKPIQIEAIKWTGNLDEAKEFLGEPWNFNKQCGIIWGYAEKYSEDLIINTLEGNMRVLIGDWIIKGIKGEFYPCKPDIFELTYEEVPI